MNRDREAWVEKGKNPAEFDEAGGIGFNPLLLPKDDCESPSADRFIMHGVAPVVDDENTRRNGAAGTARCH